VLIMSIAQTFQLFATTFIIALASASTLIAQQPRQVVIGAFDYAFQSPDTLRSGPTLFSLENHGTVRHELVISRLKDGHTLAEVITAKTPAERNAAFDGLVGLLISDASHPALGKLLTTLEKGRSYVLFCNLRDAPEKPTHLTQGMARLLYVR
jgi:hypothetical protein